MRFARVMADFSPIIPYLYYAAGGAHVVRSVLEWGRRVACRPAFHYEYKVEKMGHILVLIKL